MTAYDRAKDQHLDHTEENPDPNCHFCKFYNWIDEEQQEKEKETQAYTTGMLKRMRTDYSTLQKKINNLELDPSRKAELKNKFNKLDQKLAEHDDKYEEYEREEGQYTEEEITELERKAYETRQKEQEE